MGRDTLELAFERLVPGAGLVATVGANGRGKTTVIDNLHPYLQLQAQCLSDLALVVLLVGIGCCCKKAVSPGLREAARPTRRRPSAVPCNRALCPQTNEDTMKTHLLFAAVLAAQVLPSIGAELSPACAAKQAEIEAGIASATARGNQQELAGMNRALRANKANCTDESLKQARDARVGKAKKEIGKREHDLAQAEMSGDAKKIEKRREKLEEARRELTAAEKS